MDEIMGSFIEEVRELLLQLEDDLIEIEKSPGNGEIINNIFRVMHTLKGSAGMVGFKNIQDLTHEFEGLYVQIKTGRLALNSEIIDFTLRGKDLILSMLNDNYNENSVYDIIRYIRNLTGTDQIGSYPDKAEKPPAQDKSAHLYAIIFSPDKDVFERGLDPDKIIREVKSAGEVHLFLNEKKDSWEHQKAEKTCQVIWEIYLRSSMTISEIEDIFLFYDPEEFRVFEITDEQHPLSANLAKELAKIYKNKITAEGHVKECILLIPELKQNQEPVQQEKEDIPEKDIPSSESGRSETESTVNVSSHKLDELMNLVSELVTITATVEVHASRFNDPKLNSAIENIEKLTKQFRNNALDLRLVPVGTLLTKFKRQIRDLSKELNKKVNLLIEGQDIEIDKSILKSIESPLQHIIRNSIDHGFEPEEDRIAKGKAPEGLLKITAFYSGASVIIQVQDDGRGINLERVKECAIKKG